MSIGCGCPAGGIVRSGSWSGRPYAADASRARPMTLRQSGRFAVISKSMTGWRPCRSTDATSNPRSPSVAAIVIGIAGHLHELAQPESRAASQRELLQEAQVVLVEQADVLDAPLEQRQALDADAEREAGVASRGRSRPPRTPPGWTMPLPSTSIQPVCLHIAHPPSPGSPGFGGTDRPPQTQLMSSSPLGSVYGKKLGRKRVLRSGPNSSRANAIERALQIRERDVFADDQPFDLREHRRVRQVEAVAAVDAPGRDQPDRRLVRLHVADLHARRVRAQQCRAAGLLVLPTPSGTMPTWPNLVSTRPLIVMSLPIKAAGLPRGGRCRRRTARSRSWPAGRARRSGSRCRSRP